MLTVEEEVIGGVTIRTQRLNVLRALPLWARVVNLLAPAASCLDRLEKEDLTKLRTALDGEPSLDDLVKLVPAFLPFLASLDGAALVALGRDVLVSTTATVERNGKPTKIDLSREAGIVAAFGTDLGTFLRVLWFVGRVNFASFFAAAGSGDSLPADDLST